MLIYLLLACKEKEVDTGPVNTSPEISILLPNSEDGGSVDEGAVLFKAKATDADSVDQPLLEARWLLDENPEPICDTAIVDENGETSCLFHLTVLMQKVIVEVQDPQGASSSDEYLLTVNENQPPTIEILKPRAGAEYGDYRQDLPFRFEAMVSDPNESPRNLVVSWQSSISGDLGITAPSSVTGVFTDEAILQEEEHLITATVTDSLGTQAFDSVMITVGPRGIPTIEYVYLQSESETQIEEAFDTQTISCIVSATDPYEEDLTYSYQWFNQAGEEITVDPNSTQITLDYANQNLSGGEEVSCLANVQDSEFTVSESALVSLLPCSPLNIETPYDGLDSNCDGLEYLNDQDRDGIPDDGSEDFNDLEVGAARLGVECYGELRPSGLVSVYYLICDNVFHWKKAQDLCVSAGYDSLATLHSQEEFQTVSEMLENNAVYTAPDGTPRMSRAWVGFTRGPDCFPSPDSNMGLPSICSSTISDYYWLDGGSTSYLNPDHWWNGQGTNDIEHCAELNVEFGQTGFSDLYCDVAWLQPHYTVSLDHVRPSICMKR